MFHKILRSCESASWQILITKPTRCSSFSNLFLEWNSIGFGQFLCPSSGVFHCTHSNGVCHTVLRTAVRKTVWHTPLLCVQWKTPDDGQMNCPKRTEFHSKNKFEKLVHLVGLIIWNASRCTVTWTAKKIILFFLIRNAIYVSISLFIVYSWKYSSETSLSFPVFY